MRRAVIAALAATVFCAAGIAAQQPTGAAQPQIRTAKQMPFPQKPDWAKLEVETLPVQGKVHLIAGAGGNIAVQVGDGGVLLVDTGYEQMAGKVVAAIRTLAPGRTLRQIINTTLADAHTGANAVLIKEGRLNQAGPGLGQRPNAGHVSRDRGVVRQPQRLHRYIVIPWHLCSLARRGQLRPRQ